MKKIYIQPIAEFEEVEGLGDLLTEVSKKTMVGETTADDFDVTGQGDVIDVGDGEDDGLNG